MPPSIDRFTYAENHDQEGPGNHASYHEGEGDGVVVRGYASHVGMKAQEAEHKAPDDCPDQNVWKNDPDTGGSHLHADDGEGGNQSIEGREQNGSDQHHPTDAEDEMYESSL